MIQSTKVVTSLLNKHLVNFATNKSAKKLLTDTRCTPFENYGEKGSAAETLMKWPRCITGTDRCRDQM